MKLTHDPVNYQTDKELSWWTERWCPPPESSDRIEGKRFAMLRLKDTSLVVLRFPYDDEMRDFLDEYVIVGRPETVEAGFLLMELLAESA